MAVAGIVESMKLVYPTKADWHRSISTANSLMMSVKRTNQEIDDMVKNDFLQGTLKLMDERMSEGSFISHQTSRSNSYKNFVKANLVNMDTEILLGYRNILSGQVSINLLNQKYNDGSDPTPQSFLDLTRNAVLEIREAAIDELENRGALNE